jgi:outer membrane receptor protein involved in Fe transport
LSFISDPGLRQVVARTVELGANGTSSLGDISFSWLADVYDTRNCNDILFVSSGSFIGSGYFTNVGNTERRGAEAGLKAAWRDWDASVNYGYVDATFRSNFTEPSADNPGADANGNIFVRAGDRLPAIPQNTLKLSLGWQATPQLHLKIQMIAASGQYLRGDEANLQQQLPGYATFNTDADYRLTDFVTLTLEGENVFDRRYATFGLYGDPSGNGAFPQFTNPRFVVPAQPFGLWAGIKAAW